MHTLSNQPLVAFNEACAPSYDAVYLDRRYDLLLDLSNFEQVFRLAQDRSSSEGMNRLQRSFTAVRNPHMSKDSTAHVVPFFRNIIAIMVQWIGALSKEEVRVNCLSFQALSNLFKATYQDNGKCSSVSMDALCPRHSTNL